MKTNFRLTVVVLLVSVIAGCAQDVSRVPTESEAELPTFAVTNWTAATERALPWPFAAPI